MSTKPVTLNFTIEKIAKTTGGDKYICESLPDFNMYIPQKFSRPDKENVCENIIITINYLMNENSEHSDKSSTNSK
jgi:hypothetical protein